MKNKETTYEIGKTYLIHLETPQLHRGVTKYTLTVVAEDSIFIKGIDKFSKEVIINKKNIIEMKEPEDEEVVLIE